MKVRLAFSIAVNLKPDILLIDEVLTLGDYEFRQKSLARMKAYHGTSDRTVLFVSHNVGAVKLFCDQAIWLDSGEVKMMGEVNEVVQSYLREAQPPASVTIDQEGLHHNGSGEATLTGVKTLDAAGREAQAFQHGDPVTFQIAYDTQARVPEPDFMVSIIRRHDNAVVTKLHSRHDGLLIPCLERPGSVRVTIPHLWLMPGHYRLIVAVSSFGKTVDRVRGLPPLLLTPGPMLAKSAFGFDATDMVMYGPTEWRHEA
jgi:hypothetical protein